MNKHPAPEQLRDASAQSADQAAPKKGAKAKSPKTKPAKRTCIMVLGMHRSGTSALTRVLSLLGATLPERVIGADDNNASGYWEPTSLNMLNEQLLAEAGSSWDDWRTFDLGTLSSSRVQFFKDEIARNVEREYGHEAVIVLKEPRISRFSSLYEEVLASINFKTKYILTVRNPISVIASLNQRDGMTSAFGSMLWLRHVLDAERATRGAPRAFLSYESLVEDWRPSIARVGKTLSIDWSASHAEAKVEIDRFLSAKHQHHVATTERLLANGAILDWVKDTYFAARSLEKDPNDIGALARLDQIKAVFDAGTQKFGAACIPELNTRRAAYFYKMKELVEKNANLQAKADSLIGQDSATSKLLAGKDTRISELAREVEVLKARLEEAVQKITQLGEAISLERERIAAEKEHAIAHITEDRSRIEDEMKENKRRAEELSGKLSDIYASKSWRFANFLSNFSLILKR
ncbi:hypothetical protein LB535_12475 [Mesorhizobium sp. CA10]|uniref:sulfotransferase family protein n=1 Tax=Mesorhizobium sp. CA10 TaxID=588495 RepID=UPI001CCCF5F0|nr:hypothetical protein [Mesorhizobium sp. CA10]MBZ9883168.1 hypothetical protein [Mesorhizobium sp. CA10]